MPGGHYRRCPFGCHDWLGIMVVDKSFGAAPGAAAIAFAVSEFPPTVGLKLMMSHTQCTKVAHITAPAILPPNCVVNLAANRAAVAPGEAASPVTSDDQPA